MSQLVIRQFSTRNFLVVIYHIWYICMWKLSTGNRPWRGHIKIIWKIIFAPNGSSAALFFIRFGLCGAEFKYRELNIQNWKKTPFIIFLPNKWNDKNDNNREWMDYWTTKRKSDNLSDISIRNDFASPELDNHRFIGDYPETLSQQFDFVWSIFAFFDCINSNQFDKHYFHR